MKPNLPDNHPFKNKPIMQIDPVEWSKVRNNALYKPTSLDMRIPLRDVRMPLRR